jgi:hypothetical protein
VQLLSAPVQQIRWLPNEPVIGSQTGNVRHCNIQTVKFSRQLCSSPAWFRSQTETEGTWRVGGLVPPPPLPPQALAGAASSSSSISSISSSSVGKQGSKHVHNIAVSCGCTQCAGEGRVPVLCAQCCVCCATDHAAGCAVYSCAMPAKTSTF